MDIIRRKILVKVPHRISGFFEIVDEINGNKIENPVKIGSRGAGFNLNAFGATEIIFEESKNIDRQSCEIYIDGQKLNEKAETTNYIFNYMKKYISQPFKLNIYHKFDLPVGCGYGASGSGALGTVFGLDSLFNLKIPYIEKGKIAHIAEVVNRTGLGTICGQLGGGLSILKEPGYPCVFKRINTPNDIKVICGTFGMIHTKSILTDPILNRKIKDSGKVALTKLISNPNINSFIKASIDFVYDTDILNILNLQEIKRLMEDLNKLKILGASMNQLGRSIFAICKKSHLNQAMEIFESYKPKIKIYNVSINKDKPIYIENAFS
jgi:pantoate kinase